MSDRDLRPLLTVLMGAMVVTLALGSRDRAEAPARFATYRAPVMATTIQVTVPAEPDAPEAAGDVFRIFRDVDARMSEWRETSPLSAVNRAAGRRPVPVPADLREVLHRAVEIGDATGGAFDVTWAALWGLWDFRAAEPRLPDPAEIERRVALVDYRQLVIDDEAGTVYLPRPGMTLGLGGIAKGHALDVAAEALRERGMADFLLVAGGQVMAAGSRSGRPWRVGIRDPRGGPEDFFATLDVRDASVSTSGDYESYFELDGVRYHHVLDPRTGQPTRELRSVTVVSPRATLADALSTGLVALGAEEARAAIARLGAEAILVDATGRVLVTPGLRDGYRTLRPPVGADEARAGAGS
jgi:thiamine biosynthesis lipoprotein